MRKLAQTLMEEIKDLGVKNPLLDLAFAKMESATIALIRLEQEMELEQNTVDRFK